LTFKVKFVKIKVVRDKLSKPITNLIESFSTVIVIGVFLSAIIGIRLIGNTIIRQAQDKVRLDLNSAREVYQEESKDIKNVIRLTAMRFFMEDAILQNDRERLKRELQKIRENESLDMLTLTDESGRVIVRILNPLIYGDQLDDEIVNWALSNKQAVVSTQIVSKGELKKESKDLAEQARIELIPTPKARPKAETEETTGMMIKAAAPVIDHSGHLIGVLYGGKLLNRNYAIVDKVKDIVYRGEKYKGRDIGTATIFQGDLRISTNVRRTDGTRAIGTRVSTEVYDQVIGKGIPWIGRAFVVNAWYITAYEPIRNLQDKIIGMLYVGMLEAPYVDLRKRVLFTFLGIALLSVILLSIIAYFTTTNITNPIKKLVFATNKLAQGDLSHRVETKSHDEIGQLADSFNNMATKLQEATERYVALTKTLEQRVEEKAKELEKAQGRLLRSEKLAAVGQLAAGVAHEINNPLAVILGRAEFLASELKNADPTMIKSINAIERETERASLIVKKLLSFSRESKPKLEFIDTNQVLENALTLARNQLLIEGIKVNKELDSNLPKILADAQQIQQVFINIILNAFQAMPNGGELSVATYSKDNFVEIKFIDTGTGITKEHLSKIFDPFFSGQKEGTGLGLSISHAIIQKHKGSIEVESEAGKGSTFTVKLPVKGESNNERKG